MRKPSNRTVLGIVAASIVVTAFHYADNYLYIDEYPQPDYINREMVALAWFLLTFLGVAGYLFYRDGRAAASSIYLLVYYYKGLSSLGHYAFGSEGEFSTKMHVAIWLDGAVGAAVALCALWILIARRSRVGSIRYRVNP